MFQKLAKIAAVLGPATVVGVVTFNKTAHLERELQKLQDQVISERSVKPQPVLRAPLSSPDASTKPKFSLAPLVSTVRPCVVNIYIYNSTPVPFGPFLIPNPHPNIPRSLGSGVLVREDGLIVTNHHVVKDAEEIKVILTDQRTFSAKVKLRDPDHDLALIKIDSPVAFPCMAIGGVENERVGDFVLAVGNNLGLKSTVTDGIISSIGKFEQSEIPDGEMPHSEIPGPMPSVPVVQTNASINPGSSGGALTNMDGELIGINTCIASPMGLNVGLGFAIPANYIRALINGVDRGVIERPWDGIVVHLEQGDITPTGAKHGAYVKSVQPGSPAHKAGVQSGDSIISVGGTPTPNSDVYKLCLAALDVNIAVEYEFMRGTETLSASVNITAPLDISWTVDNVYAPLYGFQVQPSEHGGVTVLASNTFLRHYVQPGDVILELNSTPIRSMADFQNAVERLSKEKRMFLQFRRGNEVKYFTVHIR